MSKSQVLELKGINIHVEYSFGSAVPLHGVPVNSLELLAVRSVDENYRPVGTNLLPLLDDCYVREGEILNPLLARIAVDLTDQELPGGSINHM